MAVRTGQPGSTASPTSGTTPSGSPDPRGSSPETFSDGSRQDVCRRHGNPLDPRHGCWECSMEADEAARDAVEHEAVYAWKMRRDQALERGERP